MNAKDVLRFNLNMAEFVWTKAVEDLSDADLLVRTSPEANHLAWQWGHLIASERSMMEGLSPGQPELPAGFVERHSKETAPSNDAKDFLTKKEYARLHAIQRESTQKVIDAIADEKLDEPSPEKWRSVFPTLGSQLALQGLHQMWHMGQITSLRRHLNKPKII